MDMRTPILTGSQFKLYADPSRPETCTAYTITAAMGAGANCQVYKVSFTDSLQQAHTVLVKECYPLVPAIARSGLELTPFPEDKQAFNMAQNQFKQAYINSVTLRQEAGLVNSTAESWQLCYGNNTVYMIISYNEGAGYDK